MMNPIQLVNSFRSFMSNPSQYLAQYNIPQEALNDPKAAVQFLMNNGQMSQQQFNQLSSMAKQMQNDPQFMSMLGRK